jgi:hypothetical protein
MPEKNMRANQIMVRGVEKGGALPFPGIELLRRS